MEHRLNKANTLVTELQGKLETAKQEKEAFEAESTESHQVAMAVLELDLKRTREVASRLEFQLAEALADKSTLQARLAQLEAEIGEHENAGAELKSRVMLLMDQLRALEHQPSGAAGRPMIALSEFQASDWVIFFPNTAKHYEAHNLESPNYYLAPESVVACKAEWYVLEYCCCCVCM
jgi:septal ring factor EnvC (AmiA/AmiB activator)